MPARCLIWQRKTFSQARFFSTRMGAFEKAFRPITLNVAQFGEKKNVQDEHRDLYFKDRRRRKQKFGVGLNYLHGSESAGCGDPGT